MFDLVIERGSVFDGAGAPAVVADVGITGDRVIAIGALGGAEARRRLDVSGRLVCPGFIDVHSHSDAYLLIEPSAPSKIHQGVTTEVVGNCGASAAPREGAYRMPSDWRDKPYPASWRTVAEYRRLLEQAQPAVNVALLIGHNALRAAVAGYDDRPLSKDERDCACRLLEQAMEEGGRGLSTGLIYPPGMFASTDELVALASVAGRCNGIYATHMRSEGVRLIEAIDEALAIGRGAGIRVEISHLKTSGRRNWGKLDQAFERIETAQAEGIEVAADRYPYTASNTDLDAVFPAWAQEGGRDALLGRLHDATDRARLRADLARSRTDEEWGAITIGSTWAPGNRRFAGMPLPEVARILRVDPIEAVLRLVEKDELRTGAFFFGMSEENMERILSRPYVMIGSDASIRAPTGPLSEDYPHPRAYGAFARFLRLALDGRATPVEEAIRKMTSLPASHFRLRDRGVLRPDAMADVVVIDPRTVCDFSTYAAPHRLAAGVDCVIVNGTMVVENGRLTGLRSGRFLAAD